MRSTVRAVVIKDQQLLVMKRNKYGQQFYSLVGGAIDEGETAEQALVREVREEASLELTNLRLIINQKGSTFGDQSIYLCDYVSGQPELESNSIEAKMNSEGQNLYQPLWLPIGELENTNLLPVELKQQLIEYLSSGFPDSPIDLTIEA